MGQRVIDDDDRAGRAGPMRFTFGKGEEAEFKGLIAIPKKGVLQIIVGGEVAIEAPYTVKGDKLTLTIAGEAVEYKRKPVTGRG